MKALTVRQPWAWAIAAGYKPIENRSPGAIHWQPMMNLVIHAGIAWSARGAADRRVRAAWGDEHAGSLMTPVLHPLELGDSLALCVVDVVDVHREHGGCCEPWGERVYANSKGALVTGVVHLVLDHVRCLRQPVDLYPGKLGLWTVPEAKADEIMEGARHALPAPQR